jgi:hypothetical protein
VAPSHGAWHAPLVDRPVLAGSAMRRLAKFVSHALLGLLKQRKDADPETAAAIAATAERRLAAEAPEAADADDEDADVPFGEAAIRAAIRAGEFGAVRAAVARDSGMPLAVVRKILGSAGAKAITALAWKARYSMSLAVALQTGPGGVAAAAALQPRDGGYPLSESEMDWQLELSLVPADRVTPPASRASA